MTSKYTNIYSRFMLKIRDYEFANLDEPNMTQQMLDWLRSALSQPYIFRIFGDFAADDEIAEMEYTLTSSVNEYADQNFVEELLSYQMVCQYLEPKVKTTTLLNLMVTNSKEAKWYSENKHLEEMRALLSDSENKVRGMLRDRGYIYNSYLGNV